MNDSPPSMGERPNFLILCMDQWDHRMELPDGFELPAVQRLEAEGVRFDSAYCTTPICSPSRSSFWSGQHAKKVGVPDNTNFAWTEELDESAGTIGTMLREQGYYTAFHGKWHCSEVPPDEDALERYGFSDYQHWGDMFGAPLQGERFDGNVAFHTVDWLERRAPRLDQPWLLVSSMVNPHDIMFFRTDPFVAPDENGAVAGLLTHQQRMPWFEEEWDVGLTASLHDDLALQPQGVHNYRDVIRRNYGTVPDGRDDLWKERRNYLLNCMRLADHQFQKVLDALDRQALWESTVVILLSDHGEMNGAHGMHQKGAIHYDEAAVSYFTARVPGGARGESNRAAVSLLDLAPTLLDFAGVGEEQRRERYPQLPGRSLRHVMRDAANPGPRGSADEPGDGALYCWDGLHMLDPDWALTGALKELAHLGGGPRPERHARTESMLKAGELYGSPDFGRRCFYRCVVDGRHKLVRWFSPEEYGNPATLDELYATGDVTLHDLADDPHELENLGNPDHPRHDPALVERMSEKLHALVERELGDDDPAFDLDMFGTREVKVRA